MNKLIFIISITCFVAFGFAQNKSESKSAFFSDFKKTWDKQPMYNFTSEVTTVLYTNRQKTALVSSDKGVMKSGSDSYLMYRGKTSYFVQTEKFGVTIDSMSQQTVVTPNKNIQNQTKAWDAILKDSMNYSIVKNQSSGKIMFIIKEKMHLSEFETMEFTFDQKTGFLLALNLEYWESEYISNSLSENKKDKPFMTMNYVTKLSTTNNAEISQEISSIFETISPEMKLQASYAAFQLKDLRINLKSN